nr:unnamed protein product [uncultured Mediterranean phage uvMED]
MTEFSARFSLFPQAKKTSENSPDATGNIEVLVTEIPNLISYLQSAEQSEDYKGNQIVKIRLAGWNKESESGKRYQSGKVSPPMANAATQGSSMSDIPF